MTGWLLSYLLNGLWQIPLVFAAAWCAARLLRSGGPLWEHGVWVTAVLLEVALPAYPASAGGWRLLFGLGRGAQPGGAAVTVSFATAFHRSGLALTPAVAYALVAVYGVCTALCAARLLRGLVLLARLRHTATPVVLPAALGASWREIQQRLGTGRVALCESEEVRTPVTFGYGNPVIVLPVGLLLAVLSEEAEAVLAHEAAHIRRNDFAGNLLLQVATLPVRLHPVVLLSLSRVTACREMVCDAEAAQALAPLGGRSSYAQSLLRLATTLAQGPSAAAPNAIGIFDANTLERRIMNLSQSTPRPSRLRRAVLLAAAATLALFVTVSATALRTNVTADPVHVNGDVMSGEVLSKVQPKYPQAAKDAHIQGTVVLRAVIGKDGAIDRLSVVSGPPELTASALEAVRHWTYKPFMLNGEPTEVDTTIQVTYTLAN